MGKALKHLNQMVFEQMKAKYPEIPERLLPNKPLKASKANELTKAIITLIKISGFQAERINTMGRVIDDSKVVENVLGQKMRIGSSRYIPTTATKGSSDISATIKGRSVKIEVKVGRDVQSDAQRRYQADIERAGGTYVIATSFDQFYSWFQDFIK